MKMSAVAGGAIKRFSAELLEPSKKLLLQLDSLEQEKFVVVAKQIRNVLSSTYTVRRHNPDTSQTAVC